MSKLTALSRSVYRDTPFAIHATGCADIRRSEFAKHSANVIAKGDTLAAVIAEILDDEIVSMGYTEDDIRVFPCCEHI